MLAYVLRRLLQSLLVLLGVSVIVFGLLHLTGDPTRLLLPLEAREEDVRQLRALLGLDDPLAVQYLRFLSRAVRGDFGLSFKHQVPALTLILQTLPATLELTAAGLGLALAVAVPAGILAALRRNSLLDAICSVGVLMGQAMPVYWLGLLLIMVFAVGLGWFPAAGRDGLASLVLPATALGAFSMARIARMARSGMLEVLAQDYVRTARAAGVRAFVVTYKYALKNAAIPLVTIVGLEFGILLGGAVITETIFAWPGVGRLAVDAIFSRDYPLVQAIVAMLSTLFVLINLVDGPGLHLSRSAHRLRAEQAVSEAASPAAVAHAPARSPTPGPPPGELPRRVRDHGAAPHGRRGAGGSADRPVGPGAADARQAPPAARLGGAWSRGASARHRSPRAGHPEPDLLRGPDLARRRSLAR